MSLIPIWSPRSRASAGAMLVALLVSPAVVVAAGRKPARRRGYIVGTAKSECGRSLSSFVVNAYGFDGQLNDFPSGLPPLGTAKGHHGRYALRTVDHVHHRPVNALVRSVEASAPVHYQGHKYVLPLDPTDGKANGLGPHDFSGHSGNGIVRKFVLRTSGIKPGEGKYRKVQTFLLGGPEQAAQDAFYGANLLMFLHLGDVTGQMLTVHFQPLGRRLADACKARSFSRSITLGQYEGDDNFFFQDIPLGFYRLTATLRGPSTQTVRLALDGQDTTSTSVPFRPVPTTMFGDGSGAVNVSASLTSSPYGG